MKRKKETLKDTKRDEERKRVERKSNKLVHSNESRKLISHERGEKRNVRRRKEG